MRQIAAATADQSCTSPPSHPLAKRSLKPMQRLLWKQPYPDSEPILHGRADRIDALEVAVEENPAYAPSLMASEANVEAMEQEMTHAMENGDPAQAEKIFNQILRLAAPEKQKRNALLLMGRNLEVEAKTACQSSRRLRAIRQPLPDRPRGSGNAAAPGPDLS
jgi:hypothetical protein